MSENLPEPDSRDEEPIDAQLVDENDPSQAARNHLSISGFISWIAVVVSTIVIIAFVASSKKTASEVVGGDATSGDLIQIQLVGKMLVGQHELQKLADQLTNQAGDQDQSTDENSDADSAETNRELTEEEVEAIESGIDAANTGTFEQQLACVVLLNELLGPARASKNLNDLNERVDEHSFEPSQNQLILHDAVTNVVNACVDDSFDDATLSIDEEALLAERMGWIGRLAAVPVQSRKHEIREQVVSEARNSALIGALATTVGLLAIVGGFVLTTLAITRWKKGGFASGFPTRFGRQNIYIETFALWLIYFFGVQLAIGPFVENLDIDPLVINPMIMFSSLIVLAWPVVRGLTFSEVLNDIGWTTTKPISDIFVAPIGYLATLPLVVVSFILTAGLIVQSVQPEQTEEFSRGESISHPIQEYASDSNASVIFWVVVAACVAAPIVEETVFRGVLYRHLRDMTAHWRITASVFFSSLVNAFIFAAIHPQGLMLIPVLGALAVGFSLMRELRGSLFPSMIMHAMHNGLVTCLLFTIL